MTDQKERLKKLYALALRGVGGEKVQAQAILEKLLKKYAISLEELDEQAVNEYHLEYHGKEQEKLLKQTFTPERAAVKTGAWTTEEDELLLHGYQKERKTIAQLSEELNRTQDATRNRLYLLRGGGKNI